MGYRKKEIMRHYMRYPVMLGASSGVIGGACGIAGVSPMLDMMLGFMPMPVVSISYNPVFLLLGVVLPVAVLCAGTYAALSKMLGSSPVLLIKNVGNDNKPNFIERKLKLDRMGFNKKFSIREQLRSLPRLAFLFIGIVAAVSLLITGLILKSSVDYLLARDNDDTLKYQYEYVLNRPQNTEAPPGGEGIAGLKFVPAFDLNSRFEIIGASPQNPLVTLRDPKGNAIAIDDGKAVISKTMAQKYRLGAGSVISFIDIVFDAEYSIEITDIADTSLGSVIFVSLDRFNDMLGWGQGSYNAILSMNTLDIDQDLVYMISSPERMAEGLKGYMALMNALLYGIAAVAAVIGLIIIYILASISIDENKGNISLMKVFGYRKKEINALMIDGSRVIVALGFIVAVPLANRSIGGALEMVFDLMKVTVVTRLEWYYILLGFVLTFLAFESSKALCVRKIGKVSMGEALKSQRE
jgi:putative ABC transport system permease protein